MKLKKFIILFGLMIMLLGCKKTHTITFNSNGGNECEAIKITEGRKIELPIPEKEGYIFVEWQNNGKTLDKNSVVSDNMTLDAVWENIEDVLEYDVHYEFITIHSYHGDALVLKLPNKIDGYYVNTIGNRAFENSHLTIIHIPNSVKAINDKAFYNSGNLESIYFYGDYIRFHIMRFTEDQYNHKLQNNQKYCEKNPDPDFPDNENKWVFPYPCPFERITKIETSDTSPNGEKVYIYQVTIKVSDSQVYIARDAFKNTNVKSIYLNEDYQEFLYNFNQISTLENINVDKANPNVTSLDGIVFNKNKTAILAYPSGKTAKQYTIPSGITEIGIASFEYAVYLESIEIPADVTKINRSAFYRASSLQEIIIRGNQVILTDSLFFQAPVNLKIYVPDDRVDYYKSEDIWRRYANYIYPISEKE